VSSPAAWLGLVAVATAVDGVLAGASLDQSIKQLPARHRIGALAFSEYSRASDLAHGVLWYAGLGIGGAGITITAAVGALVLGVSDRQRFPLLLAGLLAVAHSFTTARAAPINLSQRSAAGDEAALRRIFDRFERWQTVRAILQLATFIVMLWAMASAAAASSGSD
jgi:hypothetical protein